MRALAATVDERPSSVAEFAGDLRRAASQPPVEVGQGTTISDDVASPAKNIAQSGKKD